MSRRKRMSNLYLINISYVDASTVIVDDSLTVRDCLVVLIKQYNTYFYNIFSFICIFIIFK